MLGNREYLVVASQSYHLIIMSASGSWSYKLNKLQISSTETKINSHNQSIHKNIDVSSEVRASKVKHLSQLSNNQSIHKYVDVVSE